MKHSNHRPLLGAVAVAVALLVSACGASGGSDADSDEKTTTTEAATTTAATDDDTTTTEAEDDGEGEGDAEAQARADSVDLTLDDFPEGWEATPASDDDEESPLNECDPALGDRSTQLARHSTEDFSIGTFDTGDGTQVTARTAVFEDEAAAEAAVAPFTDPEVIACIDEGLKEAIASGGEGITVEGTLAAETADFDVDEQVGLSATYTVTGDDGSTLDLNFGVLVLRTGDVATNLLIQTVDPALDASALPVMTLVERLNAA